MATGPDGGGIECARDQLCENGAIKGVDGLVYDLDVKADGAIEWESRERQLCTLALPNERSVKVYTWRNSAGDGCRSGPLPQGKRRASRSPAIASSQRS